MAAPVVTGSPVFVSSSGANVTVPSDAQAVFISWTAYCSGGNGSSLSTLSFAGASSLTTLATIDQGAGGSDSNLQGAAVGLITATGSRALTFSFSSSPSEGPIFTLVFVKTANTGDLVHDSAVDARSASTAPSATVDSTTSELVLSVVQTFGSSPNTESGWTSLGSVDNVNSEYARVLRADSPGASTTSLTVSSPSFSSLALVSFKEAAGGGTTYNQSVSGSVSVAGSLLKQCNKTPAGSITATGSISKQTLRKLTGSITGAGALIKQTARQLTGSITASGALQASVVFLKSVAGSITAAGSLASQLISGAQTFFKTVGGTITMAGSVAKQVAYTKLVQGSMQLAGTLGRMTSKALSGSLTASGSISKLIARRLLGSITAAGSLVANAILRKAVAGSITVAGAVARLFIPFTPFVGTVINRAHQHLRRLISRR